MASIDFRKRRAVFFDRDGTLIKDVGYLTDLAQVEYAPGVFEAVKRLNELNFMVFVVTNQSAVARGMLTEGQLRSIHAAMSHDFSDKLARIERFYYCPYHPEGVVAQYRQESELRKPAPGMLKLAAEEYDVELAGSFMVGDAERDILAGHAAGTKSILLKHGTIGRSRPDFVAESLPGAVDWIQANH